MTTVDEAQYQPGEEWVAVVTHDGVALLPAATPPATLSALWDSLRSADGADLVPHLQVLTDGLTSLPPFALVSVADGRLHAVVRGAVEVEATVAGDTHLLSAPHVSTWTEQVVEGVERVAVRAPGAAAPFGDDALPLVAGTVRASAVLLRVAVPATDGPSGADAPAEVAPVTHAIPVVAAVEPAVASLLSASLADDQPVEDTLLRAPGSEPADVPVDEPADEPAQPAAPAALPVFEVPLADVLTDHDGTTVLGADVAALRAQLPDWAGHEISAPVTALAAARAVPSPARIALSTGDSVALDRPVLVGRAPQVSRVTSAQIPRLVTVPSPLQDISRTHAEVRMDGDDVVLTDLRSTNGVLVVRPHAAPQRLQPGEATVLQPGVLVDLGEGVTFTVEIAPETDA